MSMVSRFAPFEEDRAWLRTIEQEYCVIFEHSEPLTLLVYHYEDEKEKLLAAMIVTLVHEWFYEELLDSHEPYTNPKLLHHLAFGRNPFVNGKEIAEANSGRGVNLLPMTLAWDRGLEDSCAAHVRQHLLHRFADRYAGNKVMRVIAEPCDSFLKKGCEESGFRLIHDYELWARKEGMLNHPSRPYLMVAEQADVFASVNSYLLRLFSYQAPVLSFTSNQQEVLLLATEGVMDAGISELLFIGPDALKARWKSIYRRAEKIIPGLLPYGEGGSRGIEKRRALLQYLKDRPEELRPHL